MLYFAGNQVRLQHSKTVALIVIRHFPKELFVKLSLSIRITAGSTELMEGLVAFLPYLQTVPFLRICALKVFMV